MSFPDMSREHADWARTEKFTRVGKVTQDHEISEDLSDVEPFDGIFYQHTAQEISWKPEGQRQWIWWHLITSKELALDDLVLKDGVKYRVWQKTNWTQAGFWEYEIGESFIEA